MRILSCRFKNLNSLAGESPVIDLENGLLADAGIFAITGPTGAGKTTILDAICLALYSMTPRLKRGAEVREIMTRHTGEAWSEVVFEVEGKRYRGRWDVHRARNRADGKLQGAQMELVQLDGEDETILATGLKQVPNAVSQLTGLDSGRFFRSIMLAQGDFAAFLNSGAKDRAELLEKMTGTEIYAEISAAVHERCSAERDVLERLRIEFEAAELLPEDEMEKLRDQLVEQESALTSAVAELKRITESHRWLQTLKKLEEQVGKSTAALEKVAADEKAARKEICRLEQHSRALPLQDEFRTIEDQRRQLKAQNESCTALSSAIESLDAELNELEEVLAAAKTDWMNHEESRKQLEDKIPVIAKKEEQLREADARLRQAHVEAEKCAEEHAKTTSAFEATKREEAKQAAAISKAKNYLEEHEPDRSLQNELSLITSQLRQLPQLRNEAVQARKQLDECLTGLAAVSKEQAELNEALATIQKEAEAGRKRTKDIQTALDLALNGTTLDELTQSVETDSGNLAKLEALQRDARRLVEVKGALDRLMSEETSQNTAVQKLSAEEQQAKTTVGEVERVLIELREQQKSEMLIRKHEDERKHLKPGEPCPLCGSENHPWEAHSPETGKADAEVETQNTLLKKLQEKLSESQKQLAAAEAVLAETRKQRGDREAEFDTLRKSWETKAVETDWSDLDGFANRIEQQKASGEERKKRLAEARSRRTNLDAAQKTLAETEQRLNELEVQAAAISGRSESAVKDRERLTTLCTERIEKLDQLVSVVVKSLSPYELAMPEPGTEDKLINLLASRLAAFDENQSLVQKATPELNVIRERLHTQAAVVQTHVTAKRIAEEKLAEAKSAQASLNRELISLSDGHTVAELQGIIRARTAEKQDALQKARTNLTAARESARSKREQLTKQQETAAALNMQLQKDAARFSSKREEAGFPDDHAFAKALLSPDELRKIESLSQELKTKRTECETRLTDARKRFAQETEKKITDEKLETIIVTEKEAEIREQKARNAFSESRVRIRQQDELRAKQSTRVEQIKAQQIEFDRWNRMNHLIGSATGDKFRRFAQGLTLDRLIDLANKRLAQFSDRYTLSRCGEEELELEVIDAYQADAVRPTATLSGGEGFLVSLALALGLSELSSRHAHIDSLFLDEGFATLDTETLEIALAALHGIRTTGKTIGIISHVDALKERIPVQIQVNKLAGGLSELKIV